MTVSKDETQIDKDLSGDGNINDQHSINYDQVKQWLDAAKPNVAHEAAQAHWDVGEVLNNAANTLFTQCGRLTQYWDGESSTHAQKAFQRLNATASHLCSKSYEVGNTMNWAGNDAKTAQENFFGTGMAKDGWGVPGLSSLDNDSERARQYLTEHHRNINSDVNTLPTGVGENLAVLNPHGGDPTGSPGPGGGPPPGGGPMPGGGPGAPSLPGGPGDPNLPGGPTYPGPVDPDGPSGPGGPNYPGPGGPTYPGPGDPGGPSGPGGPNYPGGPGSGDWDDDPWTGAGPGDSSGLAGFDPAAAGGLGGGPGSGLGPGGAGSGLGGGPGGLGAAGMRGGVPGGGLPGGGVPGAGGAGGPRGVPMMPHGAGGAGGGGNKGQDRERSTWLTEDEDVWTDGKDLPPPVIGG